MSGGRAGMVLGANQVPELQVISNLMIALMDPATLKATSDNIMEQQAALDAHRDQVFKSIDEKTAAEEQKIADLRAAFKAEVEADKAELKALDAKMREEMLFSETEHKRETQERINKAVEAESQSFTQIGVNRKEAETILAEARKEAERIIAIAVCERHEASDVLDKARDKANKMVAKALKVVQDATGVTGNEDDEPVTTEPAPAAPTTPEPQKEVQNG